MLILNIIHIVVSISLISLILLQTQGSGLGSAWGGTGASFHTKRGMEKIVFSLTIILGVIFFATSLLNFLGK